MNIVPMADSQVAKLLMHSHVVHDATVIPMTQLLDA
jgi:hypothetical protein